MLGCWADDPKHADDQNMSDWLRFSPPRTLLVEADPIPCPEV